MKKIFIVLMLISFHAGFGQNTSFEMSQVYPIEASHSYVGFSVEYMGYAKVRGRFENFQGTLIYDPGNIKNTSVSFSADVNSIDTDLDWRDKDLKSDNWFGAEQFPKILFNSKEVKPSANGFQLIGNLTIKGITKEISIAMNKPSGVLQDMRGDSQVIFTGEVTINRKDFGVSGENWSRVKEGLTAVSSQVNIELSILGKQINEGNFRNWVKNEKRPPGMVYKMVNDKGIKATITNFNKLRSAPDSKLNSGALNIAAYMLMKEGRMDEALQLFKANIEAFPDESNTHDSYAEALVRSGRIEEAIKYYKLSLEINADNQNAKEMLRHL